MLGKLLRSLGVPVAGGGAIPSESLALLRAYLDEAARAAETRARLQELMREVIPPG